MDLNRLKRFDINKHDQLEQLVSWCQLMGLTGKDLVSIGGHLDRVRVREEILSNRRIVESYNCRPIGNKDPDMDRRWKIETVNGVYHFELDTYRVKVINTTTKVAKTFSISYRHNIGSMRNKRYRYMTMLEVHTGKIILDF